MTMTDPERRMTRPDEVPTQPDAGDPDGVDAEPGQPSVPGRRPSVGALGTTLLLAIMLISGLAAAYMVTPRPDDEALARPDGTDLVVASGSPLTWDPAASADATSAQVLVQVYDGLTTLDADAQVRPALAESWTVADDGRSIEFLLRDDLTFSDGQPLTAADVRRSWLRVLDPGRTSPFASLLDEIVGAMSYAAGEATAEDVGIAADGRRLRVMFARPAAYFPAVAAVPTLAVVPPDIDAQAGGPSDGGEFVASGAYVPAAPAAGEIRLRANEHWWAGRPSLDDISVLTDIGGRSEIDVFEDDAVDWTPISADDATWIRYDQRLGPQLREGDDMVVEFLGFDTSRPPFDDPAVRRAVAMAVDWRRLAERAGTTEPLTSLLPPGMPGRDETDHLLPYDPEAARAELAAAGHPDGLGIAPITLATYGVGPADAIAHELRRELDLEVDVEQWPFDDHAMLLDSDPPELWTLAWSADYPHPHDIFGLLLRSSSGANEGRWSDARFDELIDAADATDDPAEQGRLYAEAQAIVRDEVPMLPLGYSDTWSLSRDGLLGARISGVGLMRFADMAWDR
jgi:ABC-type transport system substrate-binding protein